MDNLLPPMPHKFETIEVQVPANADLVLTKQYGDYMVLPPEEKRYSHAPVLLKL